MSIHKIAAGPWGCADLDALAIFSGAGNDTNTGGRNRYHCSYVVYTDGDYYYAENGNTGRLDYGGPLSEGGATGTSASNVIQAAINNLPTDGGKIVVKEGNYIDVAITLNDYGITLVGEGGTCPDFRTTLDSPVITIDGVIPANPKGSFVIKNIRIVGDDNPAKTAQHGIHIINMAYAIHIENVGIYTMGAKGIYLTSGFHLSFIDVICSLNNDDGFCIDWTVAASGTNCNMLRCWASTNDGYGIYVNLFMGISIINCQADLNTNHQIYAGGVSGGFGAVILGNNIEKPPANTHAIYFTGHGALIAGNRIYNLAAGTGAAVAVGSATAVTIEANRSHDSGVGSFGITLLNALQMKPLVELLAENSFDRGVNDIGGNTYIRNHGTAIILNGNNTVVQAHGLYTTPTCVLVTGTHAEVESCYVDTVGAANFTIRKGGAGNVTANRDIYWEARA